MGGGAAMGIGLLAGLLQPGLAGLLAVWLLLGAGACAHCSPPAVRACAKYEDDDETPPSGAMVSVHYTGTFPDSSEVFDSSLSRGAPLQFEVGAGRVVAGFDAAVRSMMKCEKATFVLQPEYGYGKKSMGKIPANSTLTFEMELVDFRESSGGGCCVIS